MLIWKLIPGPGIFADDCYLGFEVMRNREAHTILINQRGYIDTITKKFSLTMAKPVTMPMEPRAIITKDQSPSATSQSNEMQRVLYAEAIGSELWPVMISRPDISFAVGILAQFI